VLVGLIPMLAYLFDWGAEGNSRFMVACVLTSLGFALVGWLKAYINHTSRLRSVLETLFLGGSAAAVSYFVGDVLARIITG
jgi:VIT1/CCC1 family predicted Fe2+/Mn2+ transporter